MKVDAEFQKNSWDRTRWQVLLRNGYRCVSCRERVGKDADVHHLLPRSMGGADELSNLVVLCDGCHASHHPSLATKLARRAFERWAVRLAHWLDRSGSVADESRTSGPVLRLFGVQSFKTGQLPVVSAVLLGKSVLVVGPTGSGKTPCFQLPAVLRKGVSLVVCATIFIRLVSDQHI